MVVRRERFLAEMEENVLRPYEACRVYEEELVGEFECPVEAEFFERFASVVGREARVLDLACGDGRHALRLVERVGRVVALDLSPNMLRMAGKKCAGREKAAFVQGSMFALPFPDDTFDGIWFSQAFEYVPPERREMLLESLHRILRPDGILYASVETWMYPGLWKSLRELWGDFRLFFYWRFWKGRPLRWGEFLYQLPPGDIWSWPPGWHYHVHTDRWTLRRLLRRSGFLMDRTCLHDGYIYVLCRKGERKPVRIRQ